jgi:transposase-like protein
MTQPIVRDAIYRRFRFAPKIIETTVRWYISYRLSYRNMVALMAERGIKISPSTVHRWVICFVPEYARRWNRRAKPANSS